jgi:hypothetical protein
MYGFYDKVAEKIESKKRKSTPFEVLHPELKKWFLVLIS